MSTELAEKDQALAEVGVELARLKEEACQQHAEGEGLRAEVVSLKDKLNVAEASLFISKLLLSIKRVIVFLCCLVCFI